MNPSRIQPLTFLFEAFWLLLLLLPSTLGLVLYGGVRLWVTGPLMVLVFASAAALCLRFGLRREGAGLQLPPGLIGLCLAAGFTLLLIPGSSVPGEGRLEVLQLLSYATGFAAICSLAARHNRWRILFAVPFLLVSVICWYALVQHAQGSNLVLIEPRPEQYGLRASGTFFCPNHLAYVLSLVVIAGTGIAVHRRAGWPLRILAAYAGLLAWPVLLLTESRSGWIGTTVGICVLLFLLAARQGVKRLLMVCTLVPLGIASAVGGLWTFSEIFQTRVQSALAGNMRILIWQDTWTAIQDKLVWGHGPGSFGWIYPHYKQAYRMHQVFPKHAHNEYLNVVLEYGFVGGVVFATLFLIALVRLWRLYRRATTRTQTQLMAILFGCLAATAAHSFFDFNLHIFAATHLLLLFAAAILGEFYAGGQLRIYRPARRWRVPLGVLGAVFFAGLSVYGTRITTAYLYAERSEQLRVQDLALDDAQAAVAQAVKLDPGSWRAYQELGRVLATRSAFYYDKTERPAIARQAVEAYQETLELNPLNYMAKVELSHLYADQLGDPAKSLALLQEAVEFAPTFSEYRVQMAQRLRKMGFREEALVVYTEALKTNPYHQGILWNIRTLKQELGKK